MTCQGIIPVLILSLNSQKVKVRQAGIEALAVVHQNLIDSHSHSSSPSSPSILEPVLASNCDPETIKMLQRRYLFYCLFGIIALLKMFEMGRFSRGQLPVINNDGNVEFRIGADGSVLDDFFDPSVSFLFSYLSFILSCSLCFILFENDELSNTPAPSPGPSRLHTPIATPSSSSSSYSAISSEDVSLSDLRPNRNWSAGN